MTPDEKYAYARSFRVHVGVDTGKKFHVLVARGPGGRRTAPHKVMVSRAGFEATHTHLRTLFPDVAPERVLVGLEFAGHHGYTFAQFLAEHHYRVVSVMPAHTKHTKEIEDNSPLKTDAKDAALICRLVGDGTFMPFPLLDPLHSALKVLVVQRQRLTVEETRLKNRLQTLLDLAWPEFMDHFSKLTKRTPLALLERWPLPEDLLAAAPETVQRFVRRSSHGQISRERVRALLRSARDSVALRSATEERRLELRFLFERWRLVQRQRRSLDERLEAAVAQCPEARRLTTIPEVGTLSAATIVAELGTPETYEHPKQILKLAGMNLVGRSSGLSPQGRRWQSKRGRPMLRRQLFLLAGRWCHAGGLYRDDYLRMLERNGHQRTKAVAAIARKIVPLLWRVMQSGEPFERERWLANRRRPEATTAAAESTLP